MKFNLSSPNFVRGDTAHLAFTLLRYYAITLLRYNESQKAICYWRICFVTDKRIESGKYVTARYPSLVSATRKESTVGFIS